jgi:hypothetical protein
VNGTVATPQGYESAGTITVNAGGTLLNSGASLVLGGGSRTYIGSVASPGGEINVTDQNMELYGALLVNNGTVSGTVNVNYGSLAKGTGAFGVVNVFDGGVFAPGNSPGIARASAVRFDNTSTVGGPLLSIELGGITPGVEYDQLHVSGPLSLGGTLDVVPIDLGGGVFQPGEGDTFDILTTTGGVTGDFATINLPELTGGLYWDVLRGATSLTLQVLTSRLPGDIDLDGDVDRRDAALFSQHFGMTAGAFWSSGDFNDDGITSLADWSILQSHLGQTLAASPVPEPSGMAVALTLLVGMVCIRMRARTA